MPTRHHHGLHGADHAHHTIDPGQGAHPRVALQGALGCRAPAVGGICCGGRSPLRRLYVCLYLLFFAFAGGAFQLSSSSSGGRPFFFISLPCRCHAPLQPLNHALDALLLCMDAEVEEVTSYSTQSSHPIFTAYEYPTTATTLIRFKGGAVGKCAAVVDCFQPYYFHTHLVGSEGSILDNKFHSMQLGGLNKAAWSELSMKMLDSGDVSDHPYQTQFQAFFDALDAGKDMPLTSFADAFASHRVIAAADLSAREKRAVKLSEIPVQ